MSELADVIREAAAGPLKVTVASGSSTVEGRPIPELIEADRHLAAQAAAGCNHFGLRFMQLEFPGAG